MSGSSSYALESLEWGWHVHSSNCDDISRSTPSCVDSLGNYLESSWDMTDWYLVTWLLNLDFLKAYESAWLDLHYELTLGLVSNTWSWLALYQWVELSGGDYLIHFESTHITSVDCYLNAWSNVAHSCNNTLALHQTSDLVWSDVSHSDCLLFSVLSMDYEHLVVSLQLRWQQHFNVDWFSIHSDIGEALGILKHLIIVELSLLHEDIECAHLLIVEVNIWLWKALVNDLRKEVDVASCIDWNSVNKAHITTVTSKSIYYGKYSLRSSISMFNMFDSLFEIFCWTCYLKELPIESCTSASRELDLASKLDLGSW